VPTLLSITLNPAVDHALFVDGLKTQDVNRIVRKETDAGGKGVNVARVAQELGAAAYATGFLGGGPGLFVRRVLDLQGVTHDFVETEAETRTNFSVEDLQNDDPPTSFNERGGPINSQEWDQLLDRCERISGGCQWVAIGGSLPDGIPDDAYALLVRLFRQKGCLVVLDADGEAMVKGMESMPDFIKPNADEAARLLGRPIENLNEAVEGAKELRGRLSSSRAIVVLSRGSEGAVLVADGLCLNGTPPEVEVKSTIGSGDSMIGGMMFALLDGRDLREAFQWGIAAGAATATTDGSKIARRDMVLDLFDQVRIEVL